MVKQYCVCGCSKGAVSGKRSWHISPNDKPAVNSVNNYGGGGEYITSMAWVLTHTFSVCIRHTETFEYGKKIMYLDY